MLACLPWRARDPWSTLRMGSVAQAWKMAALLEPSPGVPAASAELVSAPSVARPFPGMLIS